jgi:hypothetical protein
MLVYVLFSQGRMVKDVGSGAALKIADCQSSGRGVESGDLKLWHFPQFFLMPRHER